MNETMFLELVEKLEGYGVDVEAYKPLIQRSREIMADSVSLASRRLTVVFGVGTDALTLEQLDAELAICQRRMLELFASIEAQANDDGGRVMQAVLAQVLAVAIRSIV